MGTSIYTPEEVEGRWPYSPVLSHYRSRNIEVYRLGEALSHDGYDEMGPEANLYDMYVDHSRGTDWWHREYWFQGSDTEGYTFVKSVRSTRRSSMRESSAP